MVAEVILTHQQDNHPLELPALRTEEQAANMYQWLMTNNNQDDQIHRRKYVITYYWPYPLLK